MPSSTRSYTNQSESGTSFDDVRDDLSQMKKDVTRLKDDATKTAKDSMSATWDSARKVADHVQEGHKKVCKYAAAHPTVALLVAVGVGALVARVIARRF